MVAEVEAAPEFDAGVVPAAQPRRRRRAAQPGRPLRTDRRARRARPGSPLRHRAATCASTPTPETPASRRWCTSCAPGVADRRRDMADTSGFVRRWETFVAVHADDRPGRAPGADRLVLDEGLDAALTQAGRDLPPTPTSWRRRGRTGWSASGTWSRPRGVFDEFEYFWRNPDLWWSLCGHDEELRHFLTTGWRQLRLPHPGFDLWWYWLTYLDPAREDVNPVVHWLAEGRHLGHATAARGRALRSRRQPPAERRAGSACSPATTATASSTTRSSPTCAS